MEVVHRTGNRPAPQQTNLANDPRYADKLREMESLLLAEMRRLDDPYRLWNQPANDRQRPVSQTPARSR